MVGLRLKAEIEHTFEIAKSRCTANELVFVCPECGDKTGNRSLNLTTGVTFCFRCGKGKHNKGNFLAWARALGYTFASSSDYSSVPVADLFVEKRQLSTATPLIEVELPKGFTYIESAPRSVYTELIEKMAIRKNLIKQDMIDARVGFTMDDGLWEPFAIFPVREYNKNVYYQGRTYIDVPDETTKKFPSRKKCPNGASSWVYGIDELRQVCIKHKPVVIIVESILNVLSLRWKLKELGAHNDFVPVCVFKHHISKIQMHKLSKCNISEMCFLFDFDAIDKTWDFLKYAPNYVQISIAELEARADNKKFDANDDIEAGIRAIEQRKEYSMATAIEHELSVHKNPPVSLVGVRFE